MSMYSPDEVKIIGIAGPVFVKMLHKREKMLLNKIYGEFRNGKTEFLALLAEWACVRDQIKELTTQLKLQEQGED